MPSERSTLHMSQKVFWFAASISLLVGTFVFSWRVYQGHNASVEVGGIKFTAMEVEQSIAATKDQLLAIRTRIDDASDRNDPQILTEVLPDIDKLLQTLGVAESALKRQEQYYTFSSGGYDTIEMASPTSHPSPKPK